MEQDAKDTGFVIPIRLTYLILALAYIPFVVVPFLKIEYPNFVLFNRIMFLIFSIGCIVLASKKVKTTTYSGKQLPIYPLLIIGLFFSILPISMAQFSFNKITILLSAAAGLGTFIFSLVQPKFFEFSQGRVWIERLAISFFFSFTALVLLSSGNKLFDFEDYVETSGLVVEHNKRHKSSELKIKLVDGRLVTIAPIGNIENEIAGKQLPVEVRISFKPGLYQEWVYDIHIPKE